MTPPLQLVAVDPLGQRQSNAFVDGASYRGLRPIATPIYPPSPNGAKLSEGRRSQQMNLREAAQILSIRAHELSGLELGRFTLTEEEWKRVFAVLEIKTPEPAARLEHWGMTSNATRYSAPETVAFFLVGKVYGSKNFKDGCIVQTGEIIGTQKNKGIVCCKGENFTLGDPDPAYEKMFPNSKQRVFEQGEKLQQEDQQIALKPSLSRRKPR